MDPRLAELQALKASLKLKEQADGMHEGDPLQVWCIVCLFVCSFVCLFVCLIGSGFSCVLVCLIGLSLSVAIFCEKHFGHLQSQAV